MRIVTFLITLLCTLYPDISNAGKLYLRVNIEGLQNTNVNLYMGPYYGEGKAYEKEIQINTGELLTINCKLNKLYQCRIINNNMYCPVANDSIWLKNRTVMFYAEENDTITIEGKLNEFVVDYTVTGNKINEQYSEYRKEYLPLLEKEIQLNLDYIESEKLNISQDLINQKSDKYWNYNRYMWLESLKFIEAHPDYEYSPRLVYPYYVPYDSLVMYQNMFHENVYMADIGKRFLEEVKLAGNSIQTQHGQAPEFNFKTITGKSYKLSDFKGKYVVLEFWGTWCGPCLSGIPKMKTTYEQYSNKIEFIGIACKDKASDWREIIRSKELQWLNTLNSSKNDIAALYGITSYPTKIIIDKNGNIVHKYSGEDEEFYSSLIELINNN